MGGVGEDVVGVGELVHPELVGDQGGDVQLSGGEQPQQCRGGSGVDQAGGDGEVADPECFQVQGRGFAVYADVGDVAAGPDQLGAQFERGRDPDCLQRRVRAQAPVTARTTSSGSLAAGSIGVAPRASAARRRGSAGSTTRMVLGEYSLAVMIAARPIGPAPTMTTVSPGLTPPLRTPTS